MLTGIDIPVPSLYVEGDADPDSGVSDAHGVAPLEYLKSHTECTQQPCATSTLS